MFFDQVNKLASAGTDDAPVLEHMHHVRNYVLQQALVVSNNYRCSLGSAQTVHAVRHYAQGVHIEAAVGLVQNTQHRLKHRHLENLVALLFAAGKAHVHLSLGKFALHLHQGHLFLQELKELRGLELALACSLAPGVESGFHKVGDAHPGNLHRILEAQEYTCPGALLGRHGEQVAAGISH